MNGGFTFFVRGVEGACMEPLLDVKDVAALLKINVQAVRELTRQRTQLRSPKPVIPHIKIHSKAVRFRRSEIEAWLNEIVKSSQPSKAGA
jgi:predicted DNA-binding transcriptional regulator AlpA